MKRKHFHLLNKSGLHFIYMWFKFIDWMINDDPLLQSPNTIRFSSSVSKYPHWNVDHLSFILAKDDCRLKLCELWFDQAWTTFRSCGQKTGEQKSRKTWGESKYLLKIQSFWYGAEMFQLIVLFPAQYFLNERSVFLSWRGMAWHAAGWSHGQSIAAHFQWFCNQITKISGRIRENTLSYIIMTEGVRAMTLHLLLSSPLNTDPFYR